MAREVTASRLTRLRLEGFSHGLIPFGFLAVRPHRRKLSTLLAAGLVGLAAVTGADAAPRKQQKPCAESLDQCPDSGCAFKDQDKAAVEQEAEALLNRLKRH